MTLPTSKLPILNNSWHKALELYKINPLLSNLEKKLILAQENNIEVFPPNNLIFQAYNTTLFHQVKVVILGQDPYHGTGQANGLSFSVAKEIRIPPSLKNIFCELSNDIPSCRYPTHGDLSHWAKQGVFLLNSILTVEARKAGSHRKWGWQEFTDNTITALANSPIHKNLVFILWGNYAQSKVPLINQSKHLIIKSVHPSPLSAYRGFLNSKPFSRTNQYLLAHNKVAIDW